MEEGLDLHAYNNLHRVHQQAEQKANSQWIKELPDAIDALSAARAGHGERRQAQTRFLEPVGGRRKPSTLGKADVEESFEELLSPEELAEWKSYSKAVDEGHMQELEEHLTHWDNYNRFANPGSVVGASDPIQAVIRSLSRTHSIPANRVSETGVSSKQLQHNFMISGGMVGSRSSSRQAARSIPTCKEGPASNGRLTKSISTDFSSASYSQLDNFMLDTLDSPLYPHLRRSTTNIEPAASAPAPSSFTSDGPTSSSDGLPAATAMLPMTRPRFLSRRSMLQLDPAVMAAGAADGDDSRPASVGVVGGCPASPSRAAFGRRSGLMGLSNTPSAVVPRALGLNLGSRSAPKTIPSAPRSDPEQVQAEARSYRMGQADGRNSGGVDAGAGRPFSRCNTTAERGAGGGAGSKTGGGGGGDPHSPRRLSTAYLRSVVHQAAAQHHGVAPAPHHAASSAPFTVKGQTLGKELGGRVGAESKRASRSGVGP